MKTIKLFHYSDSTRWTATRKEAVFAGEVSGFAGFGTHERATLLLVVKMKSVLRGLTLTKVSESRAAAV